MGDTFKKLTNVFIAGLFLFTMISAEESDLLKPSVGFNGKFITEHNRSFMPGQRLSQNGQFAGTFSIVSGGDEVRELADFTLFKNGEKQFTIKEVPGSDIDISNAGYILFYDHRLHYKGQLTLHFYTPTGSKLFSKTYQTANLFGFSSVGNKFGVGTPENFEVISSCR